MKCKYYYKIYGLSVVSDICIQEADVCKEITEPDVEIVLGEIPEFLREAKQKGYGTWTNGFVNAWFQTPGAAQFYVEGGKKIVIEPEQDANMELVCSMILSAGFSLILLQRNEMVLHGSAIVVKEHAFIVSGGSGAGKSTITMELLTQDVGFLADDTVRLHIVDGTMIAEPTYPQQKICRNLAEEYGLELQKLRYIDEERDKFALMRKELYVSQGVPLKSIIVLKKSETVEKVSARLLSGKEYLDTIIDNLYLADTYKYNVGIPMELMQQIIGMAGRVNVYEIYRPAQGNTVNEIVAEINKILHFC